MRFPSIKTLQRLFPSEAKQARNILKMSRGKLLVNVPEACRQSTLTLRFRALSAIADHYLYHGVETVVSGKGEPAHYLNAGDCYTETLIYWRGNYRVQSLGHFVETLERQGIRFE